MTRAVLRLTALLVCAGLATSRIGLVVHELIGHGAATVAVGGTVTDVQLFYFAGGWIRFRATEGHLTMGGIVVEVVSDRRNRGGGRRRIDRSRDRARRTVTLESPGPWIAASRVCSAAVSSRTTPGGS